MNQQLVDVLRTESSKVTNASFCSKLCDEVQFLQNDIIDCFKRFSRRLVSSRAFPTPMQRSCQSSSRDPTDYLPPSTYAPEPREIKHLSSLTRSRLDIPSDKNLEVSLEPSPRWPIISLQLSPSSSQANSFAGPPIVHDPALSRGMSSATRLRSDLAEDSRPRFTVSPRSRFLRDVAFRSGAETFYHSPSAESDALLEENCTYFRSCEGG